MFWDRFPVLVVEERRNANRSYHDHLGCVSRNNGGGYVIEFLCIFPSKLICACCPGTSLLGCHLAKLKNEVFIWNTGGFLLKWNAFFKMPFWNRASVNELFICYSCHTKAKWRLQWAWTRLLRGSSRWVLKTWEDRDCTDSKCHE